MDDDGKDYCLRLLKNYLVEPSLFMSICWFGLWLMTLTPGGSRIAHCLVTPKTFFGSMHQAIFPEFIYVQTSYTYHLYTTARDLDRTCLSWNTSRSDIAREIIHTCSKATRNHMCVIEKASPPRRVRAISRWHLCYSFNIYRVLEEQGSFTWFNHWSCFLEMLRINILRLFTSCICLCQLHLEIFTVRWWVLLDESKRRIPSRSLTLSPKNTEELDSKPATAETPTQSAMSSGVQYSALLFLMTRPCAQPTFSSGPKAKLPWMRYSAESYLLWFGKKHTSKRLSTSSNFENVEELSEIGEFTNALKVRREKARRRGQLTYQLQRDRIRSISGINRTSRNTRLAWDDKGRETGRGRGLWGAPARNRLDAHLISGNSPNTGAMFPIRSQQRSEPQRTLARALRKYSDLRESPYKASTHREERWLRGSVSWPRLCSISYRALRRERK